MSDLFDLADAVATRVNAGSYTYADSFTAESVALVDLDAEDIRDSVVVQVVPRGKEIEPLSREKRRNELTIGVGIVKKVGVNDSTGKTQKSDVSGLVELAEEIEQQMQDHTPTVNGRKARIVRTDIAPVYDPDALYAAQQFRSVVEITYLLTTP